MSAKLRKVSKEIFDVNLQNLITFVRMRLFLKLKNVVKLRKNLLF